MSASLLLEIREAFANLNPGQRGQLLALPDAYPAWVYATQSGWGVALKLARDITISEKFSGARLFSTSTQDGQELRLESVGRQRRQEFAVVCAQFVEPGVNGDERDAIVDDPTAWWLNWRELLGNVVRERKPYSVLGELLALERLIVNGETPVWLGPAKGSHDIETMSANYEVKSTISRYSSTFHAAGQFQLGSSEGKQLFIVYQRFEPALSGHCIDGVLHRLAGLGQNAAPIEAGLAQLGFEPGSSDRRANYKLLQSTKYHVDEGFPRIVPSSFVGGVLPKGIVSIEYQVDLAGLPGTPFA